VQSLKSTAFAVTLLAISFGLYCVSTNNTAPEGDLIDPIHIDTTLSTSNSGSMMLPSADINHQPAPIQISTEIVPTVDPNSLPRMASPELPTLQAPTLNPSQGQFSNGSTSAPTITIGEAEPLKLPAFTQTPVQPENVQNNPPMKLPEIAMRQPVSTVPANRDEGLIDALKADVNEFKAQVLPNQIQQQTVGTPNANDNSFNSLATAAVPTEEELYRAKNAGTMAMPDFESESAAKPAPTSIGAVWSEVDRLVAADEYRKALGTLSQHYGRPGLTGPQQQRLQGWLDALAGKVIYSTEHHFVRKPYLVKRGETIESISRQLKIPAEVIYNINKAQFGVSNEVTPGMELKVVSGPFHAEVDLQSKMLTLFVKNLYAGRFPIAVGISGNPDQGDYKVMVKSPQGFTWRDATGKEYPPESPGNGYGPYWIGLTGSLCVHAVPSGTPHGHRGCIGLAEEDAKDVFGILSKESQISIVR